MPFVEDIHPNVLGSTSDPGAGAERCKSQLAVLLQAVDKMYRYQCSRWQQTVLHSSLAGRGVRCTLTCSP